MDRNRYRSRENYRTYGRPATPKYRPPVSPPLPVQTKLPARPVLGDSFTSSRREFLALEVLIRRVKHLLTKRLIIGSAVIVLLATTWLVFAHPDPTSPQSDTAAVSIPASSAHQISVESAKTNTVVVPPASSLLPTFTPLVPVGKPQLANLGKRAFDRAHDSYTYVDLFLAQPLQVSEQPLPQSSQPASAVLATAAQSFHATASFSDPTVGTVYEVGQQSSVGQTILFAKSGLLLFLQSNYRHSPTEWESYIDNLH